MNSWDNFFIFLIFLKSWWFFLNCTETVSRRFSVEKVFLKSSPNSQENTCARASFLIKLEHRCFPDNFAKFLRTPLFIEHLWWLLLTAPRLPIFSSAFSFSLTKLQNYRLFESLIKSFEAPKRRKTILTITTTKYINKSSKKALLIYVYIVYIKIQGPRFSAPLKITANLKSYLNLV